MMNRIVGTCPISHKELESVIGRLSFTQTAAFGRIGRAMLAPLYKKIHYQALSLKEATSLRRRVVSIAHMKHSKETPKPPMAERIAYTDSAWETQIVAEVRLDPATFESSVRPGSVMASKTGQNGERNSRRPVTFTAYRYWPPSKRVTNSATDLLPST